MAAEKFPDTKIGDVVGDVFAGFGFVVFEMGATVVVGHVGRIGGDNAVGVETRGANVGALSEMRFAELVDGG